MESETSAAVQMQAETPETQAAVPETQAAAPETQAAAPETTAPETQPQTAAPETAAPETQPQTAAPETAAPETQAQTAAPETAAPETQPQTAAPETAAPETQPQTAAPETAAPETQAQTAAPETAAPETQAETAAPETQPETAAETAVPETAAETAADQQPQDQAAETQAEEAAQNDDQGEDAQTEITAPVEAQTEAVTAALTEAETLAAEETETESEILTEEAETETETELETESVTEEETETETETELEMPAQTFKKTVSGVTVTATAEEGTFPKGTKMGVSRISDSRAMSIAEAAVSGDDEVQDAVAVDITFYDADGSEIQPANGKSVSVSMALSSSQALEDGEEYFVAHQDDAGSVSTVSYDASQTGAAFEAESFSIYLIVSSTSSISTYYIAVGDTLQLYSTSATSGTWTSSDSSVASVDASTGLVKGEKVGSATITFTYTNSNGGTSRETKNVQVTNTSYSYYHVDLRVEGSFTYNVSTSSTTTTDLTVTKKWEGDSTSVRPSSVNVALKDSTGAVVSTAELTAEKDWTYTWTDLSLGSGEYTVVETDTLQDYTSTPGTLEISNTDSSSTATYTGTLTVDSAPKVEIYDAIDGDLKYNVTMAQGSTADENNTTYYEYKSSAGHSNNDNTWGSVLNSQTGYYVKLTFEYSYTATNTKDKSDVKTATGQTMEYWVKMSQSNNVCGGTVGRDELGFDIYLDADDILKNTITATNTASATITNTYNKTTSVPVEKVWSGDDNYNTRPDSVTVTLYADGEPLDKTVTLNKDNDWKDTFTDLPIYSNGNEIAYTVQETAVKGYTTEVTGSAANGYTITNKLETATVTLEAAKKLTGRAQKAGEFSFSVLDETGVVVATGTNDEKGNISFSPITYTYKVVGTHTYTISESQGDREEITYDKTPYTVTVTVSQGTDGKISTNVDYGTAAPVFTNKYTATGSVNLYGTKTLTGRDLAAGEFSFSVTDESGAVVATGTNEDDGKIAFKTINYTQDDVGTHTYTITEGSGNLGGVTYSKASFKVTVEVTDNGDGTLTATPTYPAGGVVFNNTYSATGSVALEATKTLTGRALKAGEFSFTVTDEEGEPVATAANGADGKIKFSEISYSLDDVGTHTYTITEDSGNLSGVTYSEASFEVTVKVTDNGNGTLSAKPTYPEDGVEFTNTYEAKGSVALEATKTLIGRVLAAGEFSFSVADETGEVVAAATNGADGTITFSPIAYTQEDVGTHTYTITEDAGQLGGVTYSTASFEVSVEVTDNGNGTLSAEAAYPEGGVAFENTYEAGGEIALEATKTLSGRNLAAGEFSFSVTDESGATVATATNGVDDVNGKIKFSEISYSLKDVGTHTYTITEDAGQLGGVTYDENSFEVKVTVSDNGDGTLSAKPSYPEDGVIFANTYKAGGSVELEATKTLTGRDLAAGEFGFTVTENGQSAAIGTNDADGNVAFDTITYTLDDVGTHTYTISEDAGQLGGMTYDKTTYEVTVEVTDNGDGTLSAEPTYPEGGASFKNTYAATGSVELEATKTLTGRALAAGEFGFTVTEGTKVVATAANQADGKVEFSEITYTLDDVGTHTYTISEDAGSLGGVTYDKTTYEVTVVVADNGDGTLKAEPTYPEGGASFKNTYAATGSVELEANKTLTGRTLAADEFGFTVTENGQTVVHTTNDADGKIKFKAIKYTLADVGTHTYTITEDAGQLGGVTYDGTSYTVTVVVADNGDGTLSVVTTYPESGVKFTNTYAATGGATLKASKSLTGRTLAKEEFSFTVTEDGNSVATAKNGADGDIVFSEIEYNLADVGTHTYIITEDAGSLGGVTYDKTGYTVTVEVKDNGDGTLSAAATYPEGGVKFTNTYAATGKVGLVATKTLTGRTLKASEFGFTVKEGETVVAIATNQADGKVEFSEITYTLDDVGTHTYTISEDAGSLGGVTYDKTTYEVTVVVADNGDGTLSAEPTYPEGGASFKNTYAATGSVNLAAAKALEGRTLKAGEFTFTLSEKITDENGNEATTPISTAVNGTPDLVQAVAFDTINYTLTDVGTHTYIISEQAGNLGGVTYSEETFTVTVEVSDNGDGTLKVEATYPEGGVRFTNTYAATGSITLEAAKTLTGRELKAEEFSFTATENGQTAVIGKNNAEGKVEFREIAYTLADVGTHTYIISEDAGQLGGVTYSYETFTVTVEVSDNGDGTLKAEATYPKGGASFTNIYEATGSAVLEAGKTLTGRTLAADEFGFTVTEGTKTVATGKNAADGKVAFSKIAYTLADVGTHTYTISEDAGTLGGVTYSADTFTVTVEVADNGDGTLDVKTTYPEGGAIFTNDYEATGSLTIEATKLLDGRSLDAGEFKFTVTEDGKTVATGTNAADGKISFSKINYVVNKDRNDAGTHTYIVAETAEALGGVTYSTQTYTVTVNVTDNGDGTLDIQAAYPANGVVFTNNYAALGTVSLQAAKTLTGRDLEAGEFTFTVSEDGKTLLTAANDANGTINFAPISYTLADVGTHTYTISEAAGTLGGITYDTASYEVTVVVSDQRDGSLGVAVTYPAGGVSFNNTYAAAGSVALEAAKTLSGRDLEDGEFSFTVTEDGKSVATGTNDEDGVISFTEITYDLDDIGTHTYTVSEDSGAAVGITYDSKTYTVTVAVSDNGNGILSTEATYPANGITFKNKYVADPAEVTLTAKKTLKNGTLTKGQFTFLLKDSDGKTVEKTTNAADGTITFSKLKFTKAGKYTYTVTEVNDGQTGITYDSNAYTVVIKVTDDGEGQLEAKITSGSSITFTNTYEKQTEKETDPPKTNVPKTGDGTPIALYMTLLLAALAVIVSGTIKKFLRLR